MIRHDGDRSLKRKWFAKKKLAQIVNMDIQAKTLQYEGFTYHVQQQGEQRGGYVKAPMGAVVLCSAPMKVATESTPLHEGGVKIAMAEYWGGGFVSNSSLYTLFYEGQPLDTTNIFYSVSEEDMTDAGYQVVKFRPMGANSPFGTLIGGEVTAETVWVQDYASRPGLMPFFGGESFWVTVNDNVFIDLNESGVADFPHYTIESCLTQYSSNNHKLGGRRCFDVQSAPQAYQPWRTFQQISSTYLVGFHNTVYVVNTDDVVMNVEGEMVGGGDKTVTKDFVFPGERTVTDSQGVESIVEDFTFPKGLKTYLTDLLPLGQCGYVERVDGLIVDQEGLPALYNERQLRVRDGVITYDLRDPTTHIVDGLEVYVHPEDWRTVHPDWPTDETKRLPDWPADKYEKIPDELRIILLAVSGLLTCGPVGTYCFWRNDNRTTLHVIDASNSRYWTSGSASQEYFDHYPLQEHWKLFYVLKVGVIQFITSSSQFLAALTLISRTGTLHIPELLAQFSESSPNVSFKNPYDSIMFHDHFGRIVSWNRLYGPASFKKTGFFLFDLTTTPPEFRVPAEVSATEGAQPVITYAGSYVLDEVTGEYNSVPPPEEPLPEDPPPAVEVFNEYLCVCTKIKDRILAVYKGSPFTEWINIGETTVNSITKPIPDGLIVRNMRPVMATPDKAFLIGVGEVENPVTHAQEYRFISLSWSLANGGSWKIMGKLPFDIDSDNNFATCLYGDGVQVKQLLDYPSHPPILPQTPVGPYELYDIGQP